MFAEGIAAAFGPRDKTITARGIAGIGSGAVGGKCSGRGLAVTIFYYAEYRKPKPK